MTSKFIITAGPGTTRTAISRDHIAAVFQYGDGSLWLSFKTPIALDPMVPHKTVNGITINRTADIDLWRLALDLSVDAQEADAA